MNQSRYSSTQIVSSLRLAKMGELIERICQAGGFPEATLRQWQRKYGGLSVQDVQRLRKLEREMQDASKRIKLPRIHECPPDLVASIAQCVRCSPPPQAPRMRLKDTHESKCSHHCIGR
jgi:putative transposase